MNTIDNRTLADIMLEHRGAHIETLDVNPVYEPDGAGITQVIEVIVWPTEADSIDDDGTHAIERVLIRADIPINRAGRSPA